MQTTRSSRIEATKSSPRTFLHYLMCSISVCCLVLQPVGKVQNCTDFGTSLFDHGDPMHKRKNSPAKKYLPSFSAKSFWTLALLVAASVIDVRIQCGSPPQPSHGKLSRLFGTPENVRRLNFPPYHTDRFRRWKIRPLALLWCCMPKMAIKPSDVLSSRRIEQKSGIYRESTKLWTYVWLKLQLFSELPGVA